MGTPPSDSSKMCAPRFRSANSIAPAAVSTGNASRMRMLVATMFQVKMGMRNIVMPGARMVKTVVRMFTAVSTPERPVPMRPAIQRSPPMPGERMPSDSGV